MSPWRTAVCAGQSIVSRSDPAWPKPANVQGLGRGRNGRGHRWRGRVGLGRRRRFCSRYRAGLYSRHHAGRGLRGRQRHKSGRQRRRWTGSGRRSRCLFWRRGQRVERVSAVERMPNIPDEPEPAGRITLAVHGVRDLWHRWRAGGWGRKRTPRSIRRHRHGLARSRGGRTRSRWRRRRVGHRRIRSGLPSRGDYTAGDYHAGDSRPEDVRG